MRFLHAADLHLDSPLRSQALRDPERAQRPHGASRVALARLVGSAIKEDVAALLLAGDTFDNGVGDVSSRIALATELRRLSRAGIRTVAIRGNHDALLDYARYCPWKRVWSFSTRPSRHVGWATPQSTGWGSRAGMSPRASCRAIRRSRWGRSMSD